MQESTDTLKNLIRCQALLRKLGIRMSIQHMHRNYIR